MLPRPVRPLLRNKRLFFHSLFALLTTLYLYSINPWYQPREFVFPEKCFCGEENLCLEPMGTIHPEMQSKFFNCNLTSYLDNYHLSQKWSGEDKLVNTSFAELNIDLDYVTASSSNHFNLSRGLIKHLRLHNPMNRIIYYDLGLNEDQVKELKTWCKVEYRKFDFKKYPPHVKELMNYAWKVLIIAEEFSQNRTFIYADASIRLNEYFHLNKIFKLVRARRIEPYTALRHTFHSIFAATAPSFFDYIPLPKMIQQRFREDAASIQLVVPVEYTREMLKWKTLCALTPDCIAPPGHKVECDMSIDDNFFTYHGCHRYDQSLFSTMTARMLFGKKSAMAKKMKYTKWDHFHEENFVKNTINNRKRRYFAVNKMVYLNRNDLINVPLISDCMMCHSPQQIGPFVNFKAELLSSPIS